MDRETRTSSSLPLLYAPSDGGIGLVLAEEVENQRGILSSR